VCRSMNVIVFIDDRFAIIGSALAFALRTLREAFYFYFFLIDACLYLA
jgi:hypothetical protein